VPPAPFGAVLTVVRRGRVLLEPRLVTWAFVVLEVSDDRGERCFVNVPGRLLDAFLARLHAGALDAELATLLARTGSFPVLASSEQTGKVGAFRGLGDPRRLVPGERDPLTGRITPPGGPGSRDQKNQSHESHPNQPAGQPSRPLPKPKPGKSLLAVAGAAAAVLVVTGGAFAVVKATSGGDDGSGGDPGAAAATDPAADDPSPSDSGAGAVPAGADADAAAAAEPVTRTWKGTMKVETQPPGQGAITITCLGDDCTVSGAPYMAVDFQLAKDLPLTGDPDGTLIYKRAQVGSPCKEKWDWPVTVTFTQRGDTLHGEWLGKRIPADGLMHCPGGKLAAWSGVKASFDGTLSNG